MQKKGNGCLSFVIVLFAWGVIMTILYFPIKGILVYAFLSKDTMAEVRRIEEENKLIDQRADFAWNFGDKVRAIYMPYPSDYDAVRNWSGIISFLIVLSGTVYLIIRRNLEKK